VYVVAHSQGTAIFAQAMELLSPAERSKVHFYGAGSEWFIDREQYGLASAENVWNKKDPIPMLANNLRVTNWVDPSEWRRKFRRLTITGARGAAWKRIESETNKLGKPSRDYNYHNFQLYYNTDMTNWAQRIMGAR
jgi:hypothetical protein